MQTIILKATDTLFFRDGKPFSMGGETFAQGLFPPPPSVIYGALRSNYISNRIGSDGISLDDAIKESEALQIKYLGFKIDSDSFVTMPKDLIVPKKQKDYKGIPLELVEAPKFSNCATRFMLKSNSSEKTNDGLFLMDHFTLYNYLQDNYSSLTVEILSDYLISEPKIGIGRNSFSGTVEEGKLFRIQFNRLVNKNGTRIKNLTFEVSFDGIELPESGWMTLGSDRRIVSYAKSEMEELSNPKINSKSFKIFLLTPGIFKTGWVPKAFFEENNLELITAAIGKPISVGGWDMKNRIPKPMVQAVPAGSVYYVEAKNAGDAQEIVEKFNGKSIADNLNETNYEKQGFGLIRIGKYKQ